MPTLNTYPAVAVSRRPRAIVRVTNLTAGNNPSAVTNEEIDGWISWDVVSNTYNEADTFRVSFALSKLPSDRDADWFSQQTEIYVEILAGFPTDPAAVVANELASLIIGRVDDIDVQWDAGEMTLTGRDLTAAFIDTKLTASYVNQKISTTVKAIAAAHGLSSVVDAPAADQMGTVYKLEQRTQIRMEADRSEWDLLTWLAREAGMVCYVTGQTLHFVVDTRDDDPPYVIYWEPASAGFASPRSNTVRLNVSRSLTVAKGVTVKATSPSLTKKVPVTASYPSKPKAIQAGKSSPFGQVQTYSYTLPAGRTLAQVQQYAETAYEKIVQHEMRLHAELPGDVLLTTRAIVRVQGTGTAWDQDYYPSEISRSMNIDGGYGMRVDAKNTAPQNEAT